MLGNVSMGTATVTTTSHKGLTTEQIVSMAMRRIMTVSASAPPAIRDQAVEYRQQIAILLEHAVRQARKSERTDIVGHLEGHGMTDLADIIRRI